MDSGEAMEAEGGKVRITVLCENSVAGPGRALGEHGFSALIEAGGSNILFDTGQGLGIEWNAGVLGVDMATIDKVVISHGHYDHAGGLADVLRIAGPLDIYGHPAIFRERFHLGPDGRRPLGIPSTRASLEARGGSFHLQREDAEIAPGIWLTGEVPRNNPFESGDPHLVIRGEDGQGFRPDPFDDDLSLVVESGRGPILVVGCAHAGLVDIMHRVRQMTGKKRIYAVVGGTHLSAASDLQFQRTLEALDEFGVQKIGVSHCTGLARAAQLHARYGDRFYFGAVGAVLEV